jgi:hypothetical protein
MGNNLFSTYKTGENRVTASILAVVRSLSLGRIERILGALMEQSAFELVRFQNAVARQWACRMQKSWAVVVSVETKLERMHCAPINMRHLNDSITTEALQCLSVTPDGAPCCGQ